MLVKVDVVALIACPQYNLQAAIASCRVRRMSKKERERERRKKRDISFILKTLKTCIESSTMYVSVTN